MTSSAKIPNQKEFLSRSMRRRLWLLFLLAPPVTVLIAFVFLSNGYSHPLQFLRMGWTY